MTHQLSVWQGDFGDAYTDRNRIDWRVRLPAFRQMLAGLQVRRVLEVGCNRGHNLLALAELLGDEAEIVGLEPNRHALAAARAASPKIAALQGHAFDIPFRAGFFDLALTAGVLIHLPLSDLSAALSELHRVTHRYLLAVEYYAEQETSIPYRGKEDLLWKRDFLLHYQGQFPELRLLHTGYWGPDSGFDRCHWWLLEKPGSPASYTATPSGSGSH